MRRSDIIAIAVALGLTGAAAVAEAPRRVVSVNLCTDQLALLLADPGQLVAVSRMSQDPRASVMVDQARMIPAVDVRAEEVFLLQPDLVLAGQFTAPATVSMLRRLGLRVEQFEPEYSLADVRDRIAQMGAVLGQDARAAEVIARFDAGLAALAAPGDGPRAALYYANGFTSGDGSLAGDILRAAGFRNIAEEMGAIGHLPLEVLVMAAPDVVITGRPYPGASRAEAVMDHPAVVTLKRGMQRGTMTDRDWVCGTPRVLDAVAGLAGLRAALEVGP